MSPQEKLLMVSALGVYREAAARGELMMAPLGGLEAIDALLAKLVVEPALHEYNGIGVRKRACFCRTCRTILEGQLRDVLARLPDDQRRDVVDRVEGSLTDGAAS